MMKRLIAAGVIAAGLVITTCAVMPIEVEGRPEIDIAQIAPPDWMLQGGKDHFAMRVAEISKEPVLDGGVLLLGDSITEGWKWQDNLKGLNVANHGVGWDTANGLYRRWPQIKANTPDVVFVMIGTNDLSYDRTPKQITNALSASLHKYVTAWPEAEIYVQSVLPRDGEFEKDVGPLNTEIQALLKRHTKLASVNYLDLTPAFSSSPGVLNPALTYDALHLNEAGYDVWEAQIRPLITAAN